MPKKSKDSTPILENRIESLESLILRLEDDSTTLEDAMEAFEKAIVILREAQLTLSTAEQRVQQLVENNGEQLVKAFSDSGDSG
jgi:exodeoxyribonuclease VII small subunit